MQESRNKRLQHCQCSSMRLRLDGFFVSDNGGPSWPSTPEPDSSRGLLTLWPGSGSSFRPGREVPKPTSNLNDVIEQTKPRKTGAKIGKLWGIIEMQWLCLNFNLCLLFKKCSILWRAPQALRVDLLRNKAASARRQNTNFFPKQLLLLARGLLAN